MLSRMPCKTIRSSLYWTSLVVLFLINQLAARGVKMSREHSASNGTDTRDGRLLSLFSVIRFSHSACYGINGYNGTCLTSTECKGQGGTSSGSCAAGFGVCCTITISSCGTTVSKNNTYWLNPPNSALDSSYSATGRCQMIVQKVSSDICQMRLDFTKFILTGPDQNPKSATRCLKDVFLVTGATNAIPSICGTATGQHMYLDLSTGTSSVSLDIFTAGTDNRYWNIQISQIPCGTTYTAPKGCLQWFTDATGTFSSFNYLFTNTPAVQQIANQDYTICIRDNDNVCGVRYQVCDVPQTMGTNEKFLVSNEFPASTVLDLLCVSDFLEIPCAMDYNSEGQLLSDGISGCSSKICGSAFSAVLGAAAPASVFSYRKPFEVRYFTDSKDQTAAESIGFCLRYTQLPCTY